VSGTVAAVSARNGHHFSKTPRLAIELVAGEGVVGDGHRGRTVKHRSRVRVDPSQPNLRQVHLIAMERLEELRSRGFDLLPGDLGENITTRGIDLLALPAGTLLRIGAGAVVAVTGLRNPCRQIEDFREGLLAEMVERAPDGQIVRKAGVMGIVAAGGTVQPGDPIAVISPPGTPRSLQPV